jgi:hypothetical protein
MAERCGVLPVETADLAECQRLALRDGAAILRSSRVLHDVITHMHSTTHNHH